MKNTMNPLVLKSRSRQKFGKFDDVIIIERKYSRVDETYLKCCKMWEWYILIEI